MSQSRRPPSRSNFARHGMSAVIYRQVKTALFDVVARPVDPSARPPSTPDELAAALIGRILSAGRIASAVVTLEARVIEALGQGQPVLSVFGHRTRAAAIERAWGERENDFAELTQLLQAQDPRLVVHWAAELPGLGELTASQLARKFGLPVVEPQPWLCRLAGMHPRDRLPPLGRFDGCQSLAEGLADETGDSVWDVASVLEAASENRLLEVNFQPHRVQLAC